MCRLKVSVGTLSLIVLCACDPQVTRHTVPDAATPSFSINTTTPTHGAVGVSPDIIVEVVFTNSIDLDSLGPGLSHLPDLIVVRRVDNLEVVPGSYELEDLNRKVLFEPSKNFDPSTTYVIEISSDLKDIHGESWDESGTTPPSFTTLDDNLPPVFTGIQSIQKVCSALEVRWNEAQDNFTPTEKIVYRVFVSPRPENFTADFSEIEGRTSTLLTQLVIGQEYTIHVVAVDNVGNENDPQVSETATADLADSEAPIFAGATSIFPPASLTEARQLILSWDSAVDNCNSDSVRYKIFIRRCSSAGENCLQTITDENCAIQAADCSAPPDACDDISLVCNVLPEECAVIEDACLITAEEILNDPTLTVTTTPGATSMTIANLESDARYAAIVRAIDTSDNEDQNTQIVESSTPTSYSRDVTAVIAQFGCTTTGCHNAQTQSAALNLENYEGLVVTGGFSGNTVVPGNADESEIVRRITSANRFLRMPPCIFGGFRLPLCPKDIGVIERWIDQGAKNN